jgi:hypothetical protein
VAGSTDEEKIARMFRLAMGRSAKEEELKNALNYLSGASGELKKAMAEKEALENELAESESTLAEIVNPVKKRILEQRDKGGIEKPKAPKPSLHWNFENGWKDSIHDLVVHPKAGAKIENGALVVRGGGHAVTDMTPISFREKTLEAWVKLDNLNQRAGGVVTIQSPNGVIFDSIVFAEKNSRRWLAGSSGFKRTKPFGGMDENEAGKEFVQVAITYQGDGTISGYRNGLPYGKPYKTGRSSYPQGNSVFSFGVRHLPASPQRALHGKIREVRVYDRALRPDEVMASFGGISDYVSVKDLLAELTPSQRKLREETIEKMIKLEKQLKAFESLENSTKTGLQDLALAIFNMKEFIYLK